jgi:LPXTG-motif cell wall-anchored protein
MMLGITDKLASGTAFTPTNTSSNSSSSSSGSASSGTSSGHQSGSSDTGAIAGGVVAGVVALALVLGIWFFVRRRRRNAARRPAAPAMENKTLAEAESHPLESTPLRYEADSKARIELDALEPKPATVYELPATHEDNHGPRFG